jgi:putative ABC transport system ATP-binding protein
VVFDIFSHLVDEGKTLLMVTHSEDLSSRAPRTLEIINGRLARDINQSIPVKNGRVPARP